MNTKMVNTKEDIVNTFLLDGRLTLITKGLNSLTELYSSMLTTNLSLIDWMKCQADINLACAFKNRKELYKWARKNKEAVAVYVANCEYTLSYDDFDLDEFLKAAWLYDEQQNFYRNVGPVTRFLILHCCNVHFGYSHISEEALEKTMSELCRGSDITMDSLRSAILKHISKPKRNHRVIKKGGNDNE